MEKIELELSNANFHAVAESFMVFIPQKGKPAPVQGDGKKKGSIPVRVRRITLDCLRSGAQFKFPVTCRGGVVQIGDSRESANRIKGWTVSDFRGELSRMMGADMAHSLMAVVL